MPNAKPPYSLSLESAVAILNAGRPAAPPSSETTEKVRRWLEAKVRQAIKRANARRIVKADVTKVTNAYLRFQSVIRGLQEHDEPPPQIPTSSERETAWDVWIDGFRVIPFERGPKEGRDWHLIGALLAIYEVTSESKAAATADGPTLGFLEAASAEILPDVPAKKRSLFTPPTLDSLRHQLPLLRKLVIQPASKRLAKLFAETDPE